MNNLGPPVIEQIRPRDTLSSEVYGFVPEAHIGRAEVWFTHSSCWITTPFNKGFMAQFKKQIPADYRQWLPVVKKWRVYRPYVDEVLVILAIHFAPKMLEKQDGARGAIKAKSPTFITPR